MIEPVLQPFAYDLVMADPAWPWEARTPNGYEKSPEAHYQTMSFEEIAGLRLGDLLAPGGVLILWCTWPLLPRQTALLAQWGVAYKTGGVWAKRTASGKLRWGPGYIQRSVCEPYLIGTLAKPDFAGSRFPNLIETIAEDSFDGLAREHSRKPDEFYARVEAATPGARRADIFSRQIRPGWEAWGNETDKFPEAME
jgi:N6-adenosine-specific RNA methylase IME4